MTSIRNRWLLAALASTAIAACGGGGGGGGSSSSTSSVGTPGATGDNVLTVTVKSYPSLTTVNMPYASVTICAPGSTTDCKTIDYVLVDTMSYGLRVLSSALGSAPALPQQTVGSGNALFECTAFVSGYTWGSVRLADVTLGGMTASSLPIQVIADPAAPAVPSGCSSTGTDMGSVSRLGANGILGVGPFVEDLGDYYTCSGSSCSLVAVAAANQVSNPVGKLSSDNNGVVLDMPAVPATGAATATGSLIFGVGTRSNNSLGSATVYDLTYSGDLQTDIGGSTITAFLDSGSNGLFFNDATLGACSSGWYKPSSTQTRSATILAAGNGHQAAVSFSIANATTLFSTANTAFSNLGAPWGCSTPEFDWGIPFFYGRRVYYGIYGKTISGNAGPFVAF